MPCACTSTDGKRWALINKIYHTVSQTKLLRDEVLPTEANVQKILWGYTDDIGIHSWDTNDLEQNPKSILSKKEASSTKYSK